jgi:hypothetical protein
MRIIIMNSISIDILTNLPTYSDKDLSILLGRLTLCMYGEDVSNDCAEIAMAERNRRKLLSEAYGTKAVAA